jgi:hypothetical protein
MGGFVTISPARDLSVTATVRSGKFDHLLLFHSPYNIIVERKDGKTAVKLFLLFNAISVFKKTIINISIIAVASIEQCDLFWSTNTAYCRQRLNASMSTSAKIPNSS